MRALAITWLFAGLRSDEIVRLRVGCVRWQPQAEGARHRVCLLDVPAHKTGAPFTKPVDALVGQAIEAWEAARPAQPLLLDRRTSEAVPILFCLRARPVARAYLNQALIPVLCDKAGVPRADARGAITSHRARATIATQLYNAKEPMTLHELQAWLGHRSPVSTQHYTQITPTRLAQAYVDAGYFARNLRTVEVLIDREAVQSGAAASGTAWQYFDLGHGYCTYNFFEQCPHRMACARCDFYLPKASTQAQLLEARGHLAADAHDHSADRARTRGRRGRRRGGRAAPGPTRGHADAGRAHPARAQRSPDQPVADHHPVSAFTRRLTSYSQNLGPTWTTGRNGRSGGSRWTERAEVTEQGSATSKLAALTERSSRRSGAGSRRRGSSRHGMWRARVSSP